MKIYRYDEETKLFIGEAEANKDPLESINQKKDVWLLPANATFEKPQLEEGKVSIWNEKSWDNITDNRGKFYYDFEEKDIKEIKDFKDYIVLSDEEIEKINKGMTIELVEGKYSIYWTTEQKQENVRRTRNYYIVKYIDYYQEKPLLWNELSEELKTQITNYRKYLLHYPQSSETWYEQNPKTFDEFIEGAITED